MCFAKGRARTGTGRGKEKEKEKEKEKGTSKAEKWSEKTCNKAMC